MKRDQIEDAARDVLERIRAYDPDESFIGPTNIRIVSGFLEAFESKATRQSREARLLARVTRIVEAYAECRDTEACLHDGLTMGEATLQSIVWALDENPPIKCPLCDRATCEAWGAA